MKRPVVTAIALLSTLVVSTTHRATAQSRDVPAPPVFPVPSMMAMRGMPPFLPIGGAPPSSPVEACLDMSARGVAIAAYLKARLDLTVQQLAAWQDLEAASMDVARQEREACARLPARFEPLGAMQALTIAEERLAAMQRNLQKIGPPSRRVYDVLSVEQRRIVDSILPPPMLP